MEMKPMPLFGITPFEAVRRKSVVSVQITVNADGMTFNQNTYEKFGRPKFIEVGFNDEKRFFGVRPLNEPTKYSIEFVGSTSKQIFRREIVDKIKSLHPWNSDIYNLILDKGQFDENSVYWLFDLDASQEATRIRRSRKGSK